MLSFRGALRAEESLFLLAFKPREIPHFVRNDNERHFSLKTSAATLNRLKTLALAPEPIGEAIARKIPASEDTGYSNRRRHSGRPQYGHPQPKSTSAA